MEEYDLRQCIDKGLEPFGSQVKQTIYWRMLILHNSPQDCVIANPAIFADVMKELFGSSAIGIERSIIREIKKTFDLRMEDAETLTSAIDAAKEQVILVSSKSA